MSIYLSVITPCYNGEKTIADAIESVKAQCRLDVELIIVDDGSTDRTADICHKYESDTVRYIYTENRGAGHARNLGISKARGEWITFLDADDLYLTESINEKFIYQLRLYSEKKIEIVSTPYVLADMNLNENPQIIPVPEPKDVKYHMYQNAFWTCVYRKAFLVENSIKFYEFQKQDVETAFRYIAFASAREIVANTKMMFYLQRNNQASNTHTWNYYNLYHIKAKIYYDLYETTEHNEDKEFLLNIVIDMLKEYYKLCVKHGYLCQEMNAEMQTLLNSINYQNQFLQFMKKTWFLTKLRKVNITSMRADTEIYYCDTEILMQRLKRISKILFD